MKVSIITATFNSEKFIENCIQSVLTQDYTEIEHIVIDGKSQDKTIEILKKYQKKYNLMYVSEHDSGIYDALNKGINISNGEIIGFLHSDDFFSRTTIISEIVKRISETGSDGLFGDINYVNQKKPNYIVRKWVGSEYEYSKLKQGWMPAHPSLFLKSKVYENFGSYNTIYRISADYDFILRVFKKNILNLIYFPTLISNMRVGGASNKSFKNIMIKMREDYKIIRSHRIGNILTLFKKNLFKINQLLKL